MTPALVCAVAATVGATALLVPPSATVPAGGSLGWVAQPSAEFSGRTATHPRGRDALRVAGAGLGLLGLILLALLLGLPARRLALLALVGAALGLGARLLEQRRARTRVVATRQQVLEVCEELGAELLSGRTPGQALARAAREWAPLAPVAEVDRLGGDVPAALRLTASEHPGADDLVALAAAWHVARRTGQGLGAALVRVSHELRAQRSLRRVVDGELASARATARLVAALPLVALAMGSGAGGDPWAFLLDTPVGLACLGGGLALGGLGLAWIESIAGAVDRGC